MSWTGSTLVSRWTRPPSGSTLCCLECLSTFVRRSERWRQIICKHTDVQVAHKLLSPEVENFRPLYTHYLCWPPPWTCDLLVGQSSFASCVLIGWSDWLCAPSCAPVEGCVRGGGEKSGRRWRHWDWEQETDEMKREDDVWEMLKGDSKLMKKARGKIRGRSQ